MPFDQNQLPTWNKEGVEPPQSLKDSGWQPSQKPPADYFNWFFNKVYNALKSLFTNAQHKEEKGQPNGYASLDANGQVPATQLPAATTTTQGAMSAADKTKLDGIQAGAEVNQNAFSNVKVGDTTIAADTKTDTLEITAGANISLVPDAPNGRVTIGVTGVALANHTHPFSNITNKPTTVDGYGITDAVKTSDVVTSPTPNKILKLDANGKLPASITGNADGNAATASKLQTARTISLTGDATGSTSFDGSSNASIAVTLANTGVTPGTYPKVTVDAKGRVTGGQALSPSDIPNLDWSKITSGKPTTLAGYGITDAIPANQKGAANGVASLDGGAKVPTSQLPSASTSAAGIVQLVDSVSSASTTQAATANAVKQANDNANNRVSKSGDTMTGDLAFDTPAYSGSTTQSKGIIFRAQSDQHKIYAENYSSVNSRLVIETSDDGDADYTLFRHRHYSNGSKDLLEIKYSEINSLVTLKVNGNQVWHAGNDGPGSGLDADTVDGKHFSDIQADAQAKANQAETNAKNYLDSQKGQPNGVATLGPDGKVPSEQLSSDAATKDELTHLNINIIDMAVELETLKGATLNGVTANIFIETFQNLNDINLMNGIYDNTNKRLVL